jgi:DNA-binding NtrC family response regulator
MERAVLLAGVGPVKTRISWWTLIPGWTGSAPIAEAAEGEEPIESAKGQPAIGESELMPLHVMEQRMIIRSLDHTAGNRTQAAQLLGISVRTLRNKINEYKQAGLDVP